MRERAVRTRRKPGGGKRREPLGAHRRTCQIASFTPRVTKHGLYRSQAVRHFFWSERDLHHWFSRITKHESRLLCFSRDTNHGFYAFHETRITAFWVPLGTEALQSCFFRPGLLGMSSRRRRGTVPCGSRIRASQAFTDRKPLIPRSLRKTNHETRVTAFMFLTNHEARNTTHGCCVFHESRMSNRCLWVLKPFSLFFPARPA